MSHLYFEVLTEEQKKDFPKLKEFKKLGFLSGGTSLALQLAHRKSYDFDIFIKKPIPKNLPLKAKKIFGKIFIISYFEEEFTFITPAGVKITFFYYPFLNLFPLITTSSINLANWKDIAVDKAYTIGRRAQYRDYVDLFFIIKGKKISLDWLIKNASKKFSGLFSEKLFLDQLTYFSDLRFESIEFLKEKFNPQEIQKFFEQEVKKYLKNKVG